MDGPSEITNLQIIIFINQYILQFQIYDNNETSAPPLLKYLCE